MWLKYELDGYIYIHELFVHMDDQPEKTLSGGDLM